MIVSQAKYRRVQKRLNDARSELKAARTEGVAACLADPDGRWMDDKRRRAIEGYIWARGQVRDAQAALNAAVIVKGVTRHYVPPASSEAFYAALSR